jgi:hypothetical protein
MQSAHRQRNKRIACSNAAASIDASGCTGSALEIINWPSENADAIALLN